VLDVLPQRARSFKSKAKLDLIAELDPDGTKNVEITKSKLLSVLIKCTQRISQMKRKAEASNKKNQQNLHYPLC
jgi:hypothetical protein